MLLRRRLPRRPASAPPAARIIHAHSALADIRPPFDSTRRSLPAVPPHSSAAVPSLDFADSRPSLPTLARSAPTTAGPSTRRTTPLHIPAHRGSRPLARTSSGSSQTLPPPTSSA